jgi:hypothetical protein
MMQIGSMSEANGDRKGAYKGFHRIGIIPVFAYARPSLRLVPFFYFCCTSNIERLHGFPFLGKPVGATPAPPGHNVFDLDSRYTGNAKREGSRATQFEVVHRTALGALRDLWEICEDRYQVRSTILTSQLPVSKWHDQIGDPTLADGILDRLVHNAHRIEMRGIRFGDAAIVPMNGERPVWSQATARWDVMLPDNRRTL